MRYLKFKMKRWLRVFKKSKIKFIGFRFFNILVEIKIQTVNIPQLYQSGSINLKIIKK